MGVAIYFPAPESFTGESILELHAHGGSVIGANLIQANYFSWRKIC